MVFGPRMAAARKGKGLTQKALAKKLDLATGTIQQYELGKRRPDIEVLKKIADILEISVDDLVSTAEPTDEYELILDTLEIAGLTAAPSGYGDGTGSDGDTFYISHTDDPEPPEERERITYSRLAEIVHKVLADAEDNKKAYLQKRLEAELFWPKGWKPK